MLSPTTPHLGINKRALAKAVFGTGAQRGCFDSRVAAF